VFNNEDLVEMSDEALLLALEETDESEHIPILSEQRRRANENGEYGGAASLSFRIGEIAKAQGNKKLLARAKHDEGSALYDNDEYTESALRYDEAAVLYKELGNQKSATNSLYWKAQALLQLDNEEESVQAAEEARAFAEKEEDYTLVGKSLFVKGKGLFHLDRYEEALTELLAAAENLALAGLPNEVADVYEFLGRTLYNLNRNKESINYLQKALIIIQNGIDNDMKSAIPELKRKISLNYYRIDEYKKCIEILEEAKSEFQAAGRVDDVAYCEFDIGDSLQEIDRDKESIENFLRAETLAESVGNKKLANKALHYRGLSHQNLGNFEEALDLYTRLWNQTQKSKDLLDLSHTAYYRILSALIHLERYSEIIDRYETMPQLEGFKPEPNDLILMMSHYCRALYEVGNFDAALRIASKGITESRTDSWNVARATFFEIRSKLTKDSQPVRSEQDLSFAISLLLASNWVDKAKELSTYFVSKAEEITKPKSIELDGE
jgi:tetratricopeptide (TPR) repeat protein